MILFNTSQISFIRENFNKHNSAFNEHNNSSTELEIEVVCLSFASGMSMPFNNSDELGKVSLSSISGNLLAFNICGRSDEVLSNDVCDV